MLYELLKKLKLRTNDVRYLGMMDEVLDFLAEYHWLYNFKLTKIFCEGILAKFPDDWKEAFCSISLNDLRDLPLGKTKDTWPDSLKNFVQKCIQYSLPREGNLHQFDGVVSLDPEGINSNIRRGMSPKKLHEICHMTSIVNHVTKMAGNHAVVDVGSGLGYLGQVLHSNFRLSILGLEGKQGHTVGADRRTNTVKCPHLSNTTCEIQQTTQSRSELSALCLDWFSTLPQEGASNCICQQTGSCRENENFRNRKMHNKSAKITSFATKTSAAKTICNEIPSTTVSSDSSLFSRTKIVSASASFGSNLSQETKYDSSAREDLADEEQNNLSPHQTFEKKIEKVNIYGNEEPQPMFSENVIRKCCAYKYGKEYSPENLMKSDITTDFVKDCTTITQDSSREDNSSNFSINKTESWEPLNTGLHEVRLDQKFTKNENRTVNFSNTCDNGDVNDDNMSSKTTAAPSLCMIGLHCCGDLTPTMLHMFKDLDWITSLCCISCCYHRMKFDEKTGCHDNFPMSEAVQQSMERTRLHYPDWFPNTYSMRLAAQETRGRWLMQTEEDHNLHTKHVAYRGLLEVLINQGAVTLKRNSRRLASANDHASFETYIQSVQQHIEICDKVSDADQSFSDKMHQLYIQYQELFPLIEPLTALQFLLQPVLESLITNDRLLWLQENGFHGNIVPIFDATISPRNLALVAIKSK